MGRTQVGGGCVRPVDGRHPVSFWVYCEGGRVRGVLPSRRHGRVVGARRHRCRIGVDLRLHGAVPAWCLHRSFGARVRQVLGTGEVDGRGTRAGCGRRSQRIVIGVGVGINVGQGSCLRLLGTRWGACGLHSGVGGRAGVGVASRVWRGSVPGLLGRGHRPPRAVARLLHPAAAECRHRWARLHHGAGGAPGGRRPGGGSLAGARRLGLPRVVATVEPDRRPGHRCGSVGITAHLRRRGARHGGDRARRGAHRGASRARPSRGLPTALARWR